MKELIKEKLALLFQTGFFHIFGSGTINKVIQALSSIILVRLLSKDDYGVYAYAFNIISFIILLNGLGASSAVIQLCSEACKDKLTSNGVYRYAFRVGSYFDGALAVVIVGVGLFVPFVVQGSNSLFILFCFYPLMQFIIDVRAVKLRANLMNKEYALVTNIQTISSAVFSLIGAFLFRAVGLILGQYLSYIITLIIIKLKYPNAFGLGGRKLERHEKSDYWKISVVSMINNSLSQALTLLGTFLVGLYLLDQSAVASYKVATTIPFALLFVPGMVIAYVYPYFAQHRKDYAWTKKHFNELTLFCIVGMGLITIFAIIFAKPIITFIFGQAYIDAIPAFTILMIGFFFSSALRQPAGNMLVTQRRLAFNTVVGLISLVVNVVVSVVLIPRFGASGAAFSYTITMFVGAACNYPYYYITSCRYKKALSR